MRPFQRLAATVTLAVMVAMTTAASWCVLCEPKPVEAEQADHCHEPAAPSGPQLLAGHECDEHSRVEVTASARTEPTLVLVGDLSPGHAPPSMDRQNSGSHLVVGAPSGPPGLLILPLRI